MRAVTATLLCLAGVLPPLGNANDEDLKKLQGTWVLQSHLHNGKPLAANVGTTKLTIEGTKVTLTRKDKDQTVVLKYQMAIDATKKPKAMDWVCEEGDLKGKTVLQIYHVDEGGLRIASGLADKPRPTGFDAAAKPGSSQSFAVFKREKR